MISKSIYSGIAFLLLFSFASKSQQISGIVLDNQSDAPLSGAHVVLEGYLRVNSTDKEGGFTFKDLDLQNYELIVSYIGYRSDTIAVDLTSKPNVELTISLERSAVLSDEYIIEAISSKASSPIVYNTIQKEELEKQNLGQDLPYLINWSPSVVTTSDAGAGIGYTGMRIRGSDQSRINVTINGIPLNDAESQGVFWVNTPDLASSTEQIEIQRGVGTSTNGAAAFGATVNLKTTTLNNKSYGRAAVSAGSFNTLKRSVNFGSGLLNKHWTIDGRLSAINSDGYIDRATSDLKSYYLSAGYYGEKTVIKAITFSGHERTYQSWYGTPESRINGSQQDMVNHANNNGYSDSQLANLLSSGRTYNYYQYDNEVDDYQQDHYQLHLSHNISNAFLLNAALHYTKGAGYFEQFQADENLIDYGIQPIYIGSDTITSGDLVRRRWLDNDFYGTTFSLNMKKGAFASTLGGALNEYRGGHFGELVWAEYAGNSDIRDRFYDNDAYKRDGSLYLKNQVKVFNSLTFMLDLQSRLVTYEADGIDIDNQGIDLNKNFKFFNPKMGATYNLGNKQSLYAYYGIANREPVRNDFIDAPQGASPKPEKLRDKELGYRFSNEVSFITINLYRMDYLDQLVLTGALNDVGSPIRQNVDKSYRQGIEIELGRSLGKKLKWQANATFSENKIDEFNEVLYDYSENAPTFENIVYHKNTDISFSPNVIIGNMITVYPLKSFEISVLSKYVGEQFLDNTSNENRKIDAYFKNDLRLIYSPGIKSVKSLSISLLINNIFDSYYSSNGYTYSYLYDGLVTENFYYPQAGRNYLLGLSVDF